MPTATLKCTGCKERYPREQMLAFPSGKFHDYDCATSYARDKSLKTREKAKRQDFRKRKAALKPKRTVLNEAQQAFNAYVRYRDKDLPCINTGKPVSFDGNDSDAAHFYSRAANNAMRFDMRNVHKSTKASNTQQEKYIHDYRENLINRLGEERFNQFEQEAKYWKKTQRNFSKQYLERVKRIFRKKKRVLMKIREG